MAIRVTVEVPRDEFEAAVRNYDYGFVERLRDKVEYQLEREYVRLMVDELFGGGNERDNRGPRGDSVAAEKP